jgi:regulator of protease activity HflC (stomatin/prohibitin superfamily)
MMTILEKILRLKRVLVNENTRAITLYKGEITGILMPGEYLLPNRRNRLEIERCDVTKGELVSQYEKALFEKLSQVADQHLSVIRTGAQEVAIVERDGSVCKVMPPDSRFVVWKDAGPWTTTTIDTSEILRVDPLWMQRIKGAGGGKSMTIQVVAEGQTALVYVNGELAEQIGPGIHAYWNVGKAVETKVIDLRMQSLDVNGQEILTRDRVTIRANISTEYRVIDAVKAAGATKDYSDALYRSLQYAFRHALGTLTLDQILEKKVTVDGQVVEKVRADMAELGLEVRDISLKDIILPGEMREILNQVVAAEKQAEANVIRRREETNATRSLLNTAKVMAENPVMLRLKELEALETIAMKVDRITVNNGTAGLLNDLVRLRGD